MKNLVEIYNTMKDGAINEAKEFNDSEEATDFMLDAIDEIAEEMDGANNYVAKAYSAAENNKWNQIKPNMKGALDMANNAVKMIKKLQKNLK